MEKTIENHTAPELLEMEVPGYGKVGAYPCSTSQNFDFQATPKEIFLLFMKQGRAQLQVPFIPHPLGLNSGEAVFLAFPKSEWNLKLFSEPDTTFYHIRITTEVLHHMINPSFDPKQLNDIPQIQLKDLIKIIPVSPSLSVCFDQLMYHKLQRPFNTLFVQGKFLEIFSQMLGIAFGQRMETCPVMISPAIEHKLNQVRRHVVEHLDAVPDPDQLALQFDLNRQTLKEGYRFLFGKTIHQYHADHKLEAAMQMLSTGEHLVKEIAFKIGYQNPSHFISAFKKKFGYTPKKFVKVEA